VPIQRFLAQAALRVVRNAADQQIIRGGRFRGLAGSRGGRGKLQDRPPHPTRLTSRSGELRRSLSSSRGIDRSGFPYYVDVGTELPYGGVHEYGLTVRGRTYPKRAFIAPAMEAESATFEPLLVDELVRHMGL
jgi:phage gpG-like protein